MKFFYKSPISVLIFSLFFSSTCSRAESLQSILNYSLSHAPEVKEALAEINSAQHRTEQTRSQHYPTVSVTGSKTLSQYHRYQSNYTSNNIIPGIQAEMNLYSFGAIEKDIARSKKEEEYYLYHYSATKEELAYAISKLYLTALNMKDAISIMEKSLKRHHNIVNNLKIIVEYDEGRNSEYVQAETRLLMVEQNINNYKQKLASTLSTLSKYSQNTITESDLRNPFLNMTPQKLYSQYKKDTQNEHPLYRVQQAELAMKHLSVESENKKTLPKLSLVGSATTEDRQISLQLAWEVYNRGTNYIMKEKASEISASQERLIRMERDIEDVERLSKINIDESNIQLKTLKSQISASAKVVEFYKLQFEIARRSLLDVLNAEQELSNVELAYVSTEYNLRQAMLDYLYSQGMISMWGNTK